MPDTLLGSRNIIMLNKAGMVFCPQRTSKTTRAEELTAVTAAADVLVILWCGVALGGEGSIPGSRRSVGKRPDRGNWRWGEGRE